jgi:hypothetical protein
MDFANYLNLTIAGFASHKWTFCLELRQHKISLLNTVSWAHNLLKPALPESRSKSG